MYLFPGGCSPPPIDHDRERERQQSADREHPTEHSLTAKPDEHDAEARGEESSLYDHRKEDERLEGLR